jgi:protease IV
MDSQPFNPQPPNPHVPNPQAVRAMPDPQAGPLRVVIEEPRKFGKFGRRLLWSALVVSLMFNFGNWASNQDYGGHDAEVHEKFQSHSRFAPDKVAIISVEGTIMGGEGFVKRQIDAVLHDSHVKAVVLRVDSPGGTVTGSDYIYHHLKEMIAQRKIPLVVSMGSMAASGGYYVSMAAGPNGQTIYAEPTCWTGSIGVIIPHYDLAGLLQKYDVQDDSVVSHPLKQMGSPTAHLSDELRKEERAILQQLVDATFARFKQIVLDSRPALKSDEESQKEVFTGRIFTAGEAKQHHLVDELGFIEDAIDRAIVLAGLDSSNVRVVKYQKPVNLIDQLVYGPSSRAPRFDLESLLDLAAPRAYYLCTLLPAAVRKAE